MRERCWRIFSTSCWVTIMPLIPEPLKHRLIQLRRVLHEYPELSGQEVNTAAVICKFLDGLAIKYRAHVAGHGEE